MAMAKGKRVAVFSDYDGAPQRSVASAQSALRTRCTGTPVSTLVGPPAGPWERSARAAGAVPRAHLLGSRCRCTVPSRRGLPEPAIPRTARSRTLPATHARIEEHRNDETLRMSAAGTLTPIVDRPDEAFMSEDMRKVRPRATRFHAPPPRPAPLRSPKPASAHGRAPVAGAPHAIHSLLERSTEFSPLLPPAGAERSRRVLPDSDHLRAQQGEGAHRAAASVPIRPGPEEPAKQMLSFATGPDFTLFPSTTPSQVQNFVQINTLYYAGSHGLDIAGAPAPSSSREQSQNTSQPHSLHYPSSTASNSHPALAPTPPRPQARRSRGSRSCTSRRRGRSTS